MNKIERVKELKKYLNIIIKKQNKDEMFYHEALYQLGVGLSNLLQKLEKRE